MESEFRKVKLSKKYPLTFSTWDKKENLAIKSVVKSGYFSMGKS